MKFGRLMQNNMPISDMVEMFNAFDTIRESDRRTDGHRTTACVCRHDTMHSVERQKNQFMHTLAASYWTLAVSYNTSRRALIDGELGLITFYYFCCFRCCAATLSV